MLEDGGVNCSGREVSASGLSENTLTAGPADGPVSPLDRVLGLASFGYTPRLTEAIVRLGSLTSFEEASSLLEDLLGVSVSRATVRRLTEAAGRALLEEEAAEAERIQKGLLRPRGDGGQLQQVSVDGAMVPLVGGEWAEVKTVAIGQVRRAVNGPRAEQLSYFSRLASHDSFREQARLEFFRRATENAREVVAVTDGADWFQGFLDEHCPSALRIIDWGHAAGYLGQAGQALHGPGTKDCSAWVESQLEVLWSGDPAHVVAALARLEDGAPDAVRVARQYLERRLDQVRYAAFRAGGYPLGSGIVESANKAVVEARLKGRGRHWARTNVDPMLALRCASASHRWRARWSTAHRRLRCKPRTRPRSIAAPTPIIPPCPSPSQPLPAPSHLPTIIAGRPTSAHPWKRFPSVSPKI